MFKRILIGFVCLFAGSSYATHNRAGEIIFRNVVGLTYEVTIITYTDIDPVTNADRCTLEIEWGDNTKDVLSRVNGPLGSDCYRGEQIIPGVKKNVYVGTHTYPSAGVYRVSMADPNRNDGVINIPNSGDIVFYIESVILIDPFLEANNGPILLNPPIDEACVGIPFYHNPSAYDPDGDSLSYTLIPSKMTDPNGNGIDIPGYTFPDADNTFEIDPVSGEITWDSPKMIGEYNIAIAIEEWRGGVKIGRVIRDMQVLVRGCNNDPPVIEPIPDLCVKAGDTVSIEIRATDPNNDLIELTAVGGPFQLINMATFQIDTSGLGFTVATFVWNPQCEDIQYREYQVDVRAEDQNSQGHLVSYESFKVKVIGPEPRNVVAVTQGKEIEVSWNRPSCNNFIAYEVYRKNAETTYLPDTCEIGIPASLGFDLIATIPSGGLDSIFIDDNNGQDIKPGNIYCYRVLAVYPDESREDGVESCISEEGCAEVAKYVPAITKVSVEISDLVNGEIDVEWTKPSDIDTLIYTGPYEYKLFQTTPGGVKTEVFSTLDWNETSTSINSINTESGAYFYEVEFNNRAPSNNVFLGLSDPAESVFITPLGTNEAVIISWDESVPWINESYDIYRYNEVSGLYEFLINTTEQSYKDAGLINGEEYCYKIQSIGDYSGTGFTSPLLNWSQEVCALAIDTVPPCPPMMTIDNRCDNGRIIVYWNADYQGCENDIAGFDLYYATNKNSGDFQILQSFSATDSSYEYINGISVSGCYYIIATDTNGSVSNPSEIICVDNCPDFALPNVFTPNSDGSNDLLTPTSSRFISRIDIKIYGRWGNLVYQTDDPEINWNGLDQDTQAPCPEGVYYYTCTYFEQRLEGEEQQLLAGFIHLFR